MANSDADQRDLQVAQEPRVAALSASRGWSWVADGWTYFTRAPGGWIGIAVIWFLLLVALAIIPVLGPLIGYVLFPILLGGLMLGCRRLDEGGELRIGDLFAGFSNHLGPLAVVGLIYLGGWIVIGLAASVAGLLFGASVMGAGVGHDMMTYGMGTGGLGVLLIGLLLSVPLLMAMWFAPPLVVLSGVAPLEALTLSFRGCAANIGAFLVYGLVAFAGSIVAALPLMLGYLIWGPVLLASVYLGYRDIFAAPE